MQSLPPPGLSVDSEGRKPAQLSGAHMRTKDLDKQQRIKDAMVRLILREGINGASVAKIAREAEVSPATIYVYYSSKEEMLAEVFREYSRQSYRFLMRRIQPGMGGAELIDAIVRGYFDYSVEHEEVFSFVEQCSRCPTLSSQACDEESGCDLFDLIHAYQAKGLVRQFSDRNLAAVLFSPVRHLAMNHMRIPGSPDAELQELIRMLQELLLR